MNLSQDAQDYARLVAKKREVQAMLDDLSATITAKEGELLQRFGDEGVQQVKISTPEGSFTLFPRRELWSSTIPGCEDTLAAGLKILGYGDLVRLTVNSQRLSSLVREFDASGVAIPQEIAPSIKVTEKYRLAVRKANGS